MTIATICYIISALALLNAFRLKRNQWKADEHNRRINERALLEAARRGKL